VTFTVHDDTQGAERIFPFELSDSGGTKTARMGGLNVVVSVGMVLLRTSKKMFSSYRHVACDGRSLVIFKPPGVGGVATATLDLSFSCVQYDTN
jgi:hypothetical protein